MNGLPPHPPHVVPLIKSLQLKIDLATFDVLVNLETKPASTRARIRIPERRKSDIERFISYFHIADADWSNHPAPGWVEVQFPVVL